MARKYENRISMEKKVFVKLIYPREGDDGEAIKLKIVSKLQQMELPITQYSIESVVTPKYRNFDLYERKAHRYRINLIS